MKNKINKKVIVAIALLFVAGSSFASMQLPQISSSKYINSSNGLLNSKYLLSGGVYSLSIPNNTLLSLGETIIGSYPNSSSSSIVTYSDYGNIYLLQSNSWKLIGSPSNFNYTPINSLSNVQFNTDGSLQSVEVITPDGNYLYSNGTWNLNTASLPSNKNITPANKIMGYAYSDANASSSSSSSILEWTSQDIYIVQLTSNGRVL